MPEAPVRPHAPSRRLLAGSVLTSLLAGGVAAAPSASAAPSPIVAKVAPAAVVAAVDHSWPMLHEARRYARREGLHISFVRASAQALPFAGSSATGYGMGGSLNEIGDIDGALHEARRVLRAGGRLVSMNLLRANSGRGRLLQRLLMAGGIEFPAEEQLKHHFTAAGLRLVAHWRWRVVAVSLLLPE